MHITMLQALWSKTGCGCQFLMKTKSSHHTMFPQQTFEMKGPPHIPTARSYHRQVLGLHRHTRALFLLDLAEVTGTPVPSPVQGEDRNRGDFIPSAHILRWFLYLIILYSPFLSLTSPTDLHLILDLFFTRKPLHFRLAPHPSLSLWLYSHITPPDSRLIHPRSTRNSSHPLSPQFPCILLNLSPVLLFPHSHSSISPV